MTKTNKFNNGEFQQVCDCMVVLECIECGNMMSASCLAQARFNHENTSLQIQDSNNADVLLDSGLKLSDIIVTGSKLLSYWKNMWLRMMCCLQIIWQKIENPSGGCGVLPFCMGRTWFKLAVTSSNQFLPVVVHDR